MHAGVPVRIKAFLIDYLLIAAYIILLGLVSVFLFPQIQRLFAGPPALAQTAGFFLMTLPVSAYFIISDSAAGRGSLGKRIVGLQVTDLRCRPLSLPRSILRTALKFLPWELSHFLVYRLVGTGDGEGVPISLSILGILIYALMALYMIVPFLNQRKQSVYDLLTLTQVIRTTETERREPVFRRKIRL
ncbi:RDD family protein [Bhargavaea ullalensis]|uniref:RDD family membrane protein YckC n=1 Tax=Bhargavaea ullalensis TaxID=1265685 RepID=A0ABV2G7J1_9BACL